MSGMVSSSGYTRLNIVPTLRKLTVQTKSSLCHGRDRYAQGAVETQRENAKVSQETQIQS